MAKTKEKKRIKIPKEVMEKVLYLDCREEDNIRRLEKSLMKLPFIKSKDDLETDRLEELIKKIESKNMIHLSYIMRSIVDGQDYYSGMVKTDVEVKGEWLKTVNGITIREVLMKTLFFFYYRL